jgi:cell wall-associated NlpC family hydrolase
MPKYITRTLVRVPVLTLICAMMFGLIAQQSSDTARGLTRSPDVTSVGAQSAVGSSVSAVQVATVTATTPKRLRAFSYALKQHYEPYSYGHAGPSSWDCSGLVMRSYASVGISLPRTTTGMLGSSKLIRVSATYAYAHKGTLAFHGTGHVELVSSYKYMYGAHHSGTSVTYRAWYDRGVWKFYRIAGAG